MPEEKEIATVWRKNLKKMLNFLNLVKTGVKGFVKDEQLLPLRNVVIKVEGNSLIYKVTKNQAHFRIILPNGKMNLIFSADGYKSKSVTVAIFNDNVLDLGDVILTKYNGTIQEEIIQTNYENSEQYKGSIEVFSDIMGYVLDLQNHPLANAKISVSNSSIFTFTNSSGIFVLNGLSGVDVELIAEAPKHISQKKY